MAEVIQTCVYSPNHTLELVQGDITLETTDAIVNAANAHLVHGGGVAGAIVQRGGMIIQQESSAWVKQNGPVSHSKPAVTSAGNLACRYILHAVGPIWGEGDEIEKLKQTLTGILDTAESLALSTLAIPPISTGIFGFPIELAAPLFYQAVEDYFTGHPNSGIILIRFTIIDSPTLKLFAKYFPSHSRISQ